MLEYLVFKVQYKDATAKDYVPDFAERIEPEIALEVLMAADYLEGARSSSSSETSNSPLADACRSRSMSAGDARELGSLLVTDVARSNVP